MKLVLQSLRTGEVEVVEAPCPSVGPGQLLIETSFSLISSGTERMMSDFARSGWIGKARQHPDRVTQLVSKIRTDGLAPALETVAERINRPFAPGYCSAGIIAEVGTGVTGFSRGDRVACNGHHAEFVAASANLCARIPAGVSDMEAAFTVPGAIALQGIRLAQPTLGESICVIGLGAIGQLCVQLLRANGCRILAMDPDAERSRLARRFGAETIDLAAGVDPVAAAEIFSEGRGMDAVILCPATRSREPVTHAARMCRKRGRIVLIGTAGLALPRDEFYRKELSFQVSCSYGPGRYDPDYESGKQDYPIGHVRWTAQRNFEAVLRLLADGQLKVNPLISHCFPVKSAATAYALIASREPSLGILFNYGKRSIPPAGFDPTPRSQTISLAPPALATGHGVRLGVIGAGGFARSILIPAFRKAGASLIAIASRTGISGLDAARKFGFERTTTDVGSLLEDPGIDAIIIATPHDLHADLACRALQSGKHVFVEKPLALSHDQLDRIDAAANAAETLLMVGFNRRFAPLVRKMAERLRICRGPRAMILTVNAGRLPAAHWANDPEAGGGRMVGEACHFIDLLRHLAGQPIRQFQVQKSSPEIASFSLAFADGSIGTVHYFANGSRCFPKERLEVFADGRILALDNFRVLRGHGWRDFRRRRLWRQDKGHGACAASFLQAIRQKRARPIPYAELLEVSRISIELQEAVRR